MAEEEIYLVPSNPHWPKKFEKEKRLIQKTLGNFITKGVYHVGSTSIPGIFAKPIIDIMVGVDTLEDSQPCIKLLESIHYCYYPYRPEIMHWFCKPTLQHREFHLYLMVANSPEWEARIIFRNYLQNHQEEKKAYEVLKISLAEKFRYDREAYTDAKTAFINHIVEKARQDLSKTS